MAAVVFKYATDKMGISSRHHNPAANSRRAAVEEFLRRKGWHCIGSQGFYSELSFGTAKDQLLSQANALQDIEDLLIWKPSLKECFKDSLIIVGQVYDIESLTKNSSVKKDTRNDRGNKQAFSLDLESPKESTFKKDRGLQNEHAKKTPIANAIKASNMGQPKANTPSSPRHKNTTRPPRVRPMGSASKVTSRAIVNFPKTPVKTANNKGATSILIPGLCPSDINSNLLSDEENSDNYEEDEMTPLYLTGLEEEDPSGAKVARCTCETNRSYHVETFVKRESCVKNLCCPNINVDPSERVVV